MDSKVNVYLGFELSSISYPGIHVQIAFNGQFGGLWGHGSLQMASEIKHDIRLGKNNLDYPGVHVLCMLPISIDSHFVGLWGYGRRQNPSEVIAGPGIEVSDLNYLCHYASLASGAFSGLIKRRRRRRRRRRPIRTVRPVYFATGRMTFSRLWVPCKLPNR